MPDGWYRVSGESELLLKEPSETTMSSEFRNGGLLQQQIVRLSEVDEFFKLVKFRLVSSFRREMHHEIEAGDFGPDLKRDQAGLWDLDGWVSKNRLDGRVVKDELIFVVHFDHLARHSPGVELGKRRVGDIDRHDKIAINRCIVFSDLLAAMEKTTRELGRVLYPDASTSTGERAIFERGSLKFQGVTRCFQTIEMTVF